MRNLTGKVFPQGIEHINLTQRIRIKQVVRRTISFSSSC
ncbi:TPA: hypothetical protein R4S64_002151 [Kluyvera georgiana]|nr:hypothetical protein [Kluyvera georgiana]